MDLGLKPGLATYRHRPQRLEGPPTKSVHQASHGDDVLLALVEEQCEIASVSLRKGDHKQAIQLLHRAFRLAEAHVPSDDGCSPEAVPSPVGMLARAAARLQLCVALSRNRRHAAALVEARAAALEMDQVWRTLLVASVEQEAATVNGDLATPAEPFRALLRDPPRWIEKAVEVSVQARHCVALELEFGTPHSNTTPAWVEDLGGVAAAADAAAAVTEEAEDAPDCAADEHIDALLAGDEEGASKEGRSDERLSLLPKSALDEIELLHNEGLNLARELLPAGHPVRSHTERVYEQWQQRRQVALPCIPSTVVEGGRGISPQRSMSQQTGLSPFARLSRRNRLAFIPDAFAKTGDSFSCDGSASTWSPQTTQSSVCMFDKSGSNWSVKSTCTSSSPKSAQPGDVYINSLPKVDNTAEQRRRQRRKPRRAHARPSTVDPCRSRDADMMVEPIMPARAPSTAPDLDPFEDWRKNDAAPDWEKMSYKQRLLLTDAGHIELKRDLNLNARKFKMGIKELDSDRLFEIRTLYCPSGIAAIRKSEKHADVFKKTEGEFTGQDAKRKETNHELFSRYGLNRSKSEPDMKRLSALLTASTSGPGFALARRSLDLRQKTISQISHSFEEKTAQKELWRRQTPKVLRCCGSM